MNKYIEAEKLKAEIEFAKSIYGNPKRVIHGVADAFRQDGRAAMCDDILKKIASLQQEQPVTKEPISHLEHWLAFFGCPEENIEKCATQIAQGYGAIRYLEGVQRGAEAVNELAKQEQPEVELEKEFNSFLDNVEGVPRMWHSDEQIEWAKNIARHFYELGLNARMEE